MKIAGEYLFEGPQDVVWETLMDPDVLASVLPGCEKLERVGEDEYEGALEIKIGPVQGAFKGKVKLSDIVKPDSYTMRVDGQGAAGFVNATGHLKLRPENGQTHVDYEGDAQVGGRLAAVGQRLVESSAKAIIRQSLDGLNEAVKARAAGAGASGSGASGAGGGAFEADESAAVPADAAGAVGPGGGSNWDPNPPEAASGPGGPASGPDSPAAGHNSPPDRPTARAAPKRRSQAEFATNVARDVAADMIPAAVRWGLGIAALIAVLYFIYAVLA